MFRLWLEIRLQKRKRKLYVTTFYVIANVHLYSDRMIRILTETFTG